MFPYHATCMFKPQMRDVTCQAHLLSIRLVQSELSLCTLSESVKAETQPRAPWDPVVVLHTWSAGITSLKVRNSNHVPLRDFSAIHTINN